MRTEFLRIIWRLTACACALTGTAAQSEDLQLKSPDANDRLMLVLVSGRVIQGELTPRPGGYDVTLPAGRMFVPSRQIRFTATSMDDAYLGMRSSIAELTPEAHLALARWCLNNRLTSRARLEILDALKLDPYRDDARRMLEDLVGEQRKVIAAEQPAAPEESTFERKYADRRSLGGLPSDLARQFTQRIQPLVTAKCGNARCHSTGSSLSADRSFQLVPTLRRPTAAMTEQNLASVLRHIDLRQPASSPLLQATEGLHGGNRQLMFSSRTGGRQLQILKNWVFGVANALGPTPRAATRPVESQSVETIGEVSEPAAAVATSAPVHFADTSPAGSTLTDSQAEQEFLTAARAATRSDAFDPNEFNQRYHQRTQKRRTARPQSPLEDVR